MVDNTSLLLPNAGDVWPRRDLGAAEDWGRKIENRVEGAERAILQLNQTLNNLSRGVSSRDSVVAGQMAVIASQQETILAILNRLFPGELDDIG